MRQHYASLSDEALLEIDRADLVEAAQICYDNEMQQLQLQTLGRAAQAQTLEGPDEDLENEDEPSGAGDKPGWLEDSAEVYSAYIHPGNDGRAGFRKRS